MNKKSKFEMQDVGSRDQGKIRYLCLLCKHYLDQHDVESGDAVCWHCRKTYWPMASYKDEVHVCKPSPIKFQAWGILLKEEASVHLD